METSDAIRALAALAHAARLATFRMLIVAGPAGLPAGVIAGRQGVPASTMSGYLTHLSDAGLLRAWRVRRQIYYAADIAGTRSLLAFLVADCCHGEPEICGDLARLAAAGAAPA